MKQENSNVNSEEFDYQDFKINEKDFRMWVFDRHNPEDSAIFEPVSIPDRNRLIEQIPPEYTEIREFIANSPVDELAAEITETRKQHRKELEQEYIKEMLANEKQAETDSFDVKSENLRKALTQAYENTDARISFSSLDYSQIKKETTNRQKQSVNNTDGESEDNKTNSQLKKYRTANICLIALIFALLAFFLGQRYIERNSTDELSLFNPTTDSTSLLSENQATDSLEENKTLKPDASLININTATKQELQTLEDIGEIRAQRIIEYRETYGDFSSTRELLKVSGIGEKTYEKIKDKITVD